MLQVPKWLGRFMHLILFLVYAEWLWQQSNTLFEERIDKSLQQGKNLEGAPLEKRDHQIISYVL